MITLVDPEAGVRGGSLCMYITPKDFLGKILEPTGYPYALRKFYEPKGDVLTDYDDNK